MAGRKSVTMLERLDDSPAWPLGRSGMEMKAYMEDVRMVKSA
jgi:hypothetical protein